MLAMPSDGCTTSQTICAYLLYGEIRCWMVLFYVFSFKLTCARADNFHRKEVTYNCTENMKIIKHFPSFNCFIRDIPYNGMQSSL
jgi:hypothetical protein